MIAVQHEEDQCGWQCLDVQQVDSYDELVALQRYDYPGYEFYLTEHDFDTAERIVYDCGSSFRFAHTVSLRGIRAFPMFESSDDLSLETKNIQKTAQTFFSSKENTTMPIKAFESLTREEYKALKTVGVLQEHYPQATGDFDSDFARTIVIKTTVHGSKETYYDKAQEAGIVNIDALRDFSYAGYEHVMEYEVNTNTGKSKLVAVDGRKLADA